LDKGVGKSLPTFPAPRLNARVVRDGTHRWFDLIPVVDRTKGRPMANGDLTIPQAVGFVGLQLSGGLAVLIQSSWHSILLGISWLPIITIYPLMKRITYWPQGVLGLAWNWGALLGWSVVAGSVNWAVCLPLYAGGIAWTLVYDTIYAHQDKEDDVKMGIRSTALLFGEHTRSVLSAFSVTSVGLIGTAGYMVDTLTGVVGVPFYAGLGVGAIQLARVLRQTDFEDRASCWKGFVGCGWYGFWIGTGAVGNYLYLML